MQKQLCNGERKERKGKDLSMKRIITILKIRNSMISLLSSDNSLNRKNTIVE